MKPTDLLKLPIGTKIKAKDSVNCSHIFKQPCELWRAKSIKDIEDGEFQWGLKIKDGVCNEFKASELELCD